ncbi:MAG: S41 family peptidase, partial [Brevundimonas sp.]
MRTVLSLLLAFVCTLPATAGARQAEPDAAAYRQDALSIEGLINSKYAYLDRLPDGAAPTSPVLRAEA